MGAIMIFSEVGAIRTELDTNLGLNELTVAPGFGIHAGTPYFSPAGAASGEQAVLSIDGRHGWPVLIGGARALEVVRQTVRSRAPRIQPVPHPALKPIAGTRPRPYAGPTRHIPEGP